MKRTLRHPIRGDHLHPKPPSRLPRLPTWRAQARQPRMRPRKSVNVASLVGSPEDEPSRPNVRLRVVGGVVIALFLVLVLRLWTLQVVDGKTYAAAVTRNQVRVVSVPAPRGEIVDRNGTVLAGDVPRAGDPPVASDRTVRSLHRGQGGGPGGSRPPRRSRRPSPTPSTASTPRSPFSTTHRWPRSSTSMSTTSEYPGVTVQEVSQRDYPQNQNSGTDVGTAVLGYVSPISAAELKANPHAGYSQASQFGQSGLENEYEQYLRGHAGRAGPLGRCPGRGGRDPPYDRPPRRATPSSPTSTSACKRPCRPHCRTTSRPTSTRSTRSTGKLPTANDGAAVVLDAQTGAVLAMASYPTYDLSVWLGGISQANYSALSAGCNTTSTTTGCPLINYAIDGLYTPGVDLQTQHRHRRPRRRRHQRQPIRRRHRRLPRAAEVHLGLYLYRRRGVRRR